MSGILFFDGACGFCTRSVNFLLRLDRTGELKTEHSFSLLGARFLTLHYEISRISQDASPAI